MWSMCGERSPSNISKRIHVYNQRCFGGLFDIHRAHLCDFGNAMRIALLCAFRIDIYGNTYALRSACCRAAVAVNSSKSNRLFCYYLILFCMVGGMLIMNLRNWIKMILFNIQCVYVHMCFDFVYINIIKDTLLLRSGEIKGFGACVKPVAYF